MQDPVAEKVQYPESFDGRFFFTNWTDTDFVTRWNKVEYVFPANKTSPIIIPSETLQGIQNIRKMWAEQLAEREYLQSDAVKKMTDKVGEGQGLHAALTYAPLVKNRQTGEWDDRSPLAPLALKCLEPLPVEHAKVSVLPEKEMRLKGNSKVLNAKVSEDGSIQGDTLVNGTVVA